MWVVGGVGFWIVSGWSGVLTGTDSLRPGSLWSHPRYCLVAVPGCRAAAYKVGRVDGALEVACFPSFSCGLFF